MFEALMAIAALVSAGTGVASALKKPPTPQLPDAPPPPPTIDDAARKQEEAARMRKRRGFASTILTGQQGAGLPTTAAKTLLGQ